MPIKVELLDRYQLRTRENNPNLLVLPVVEILPSEGFYFPFISKINISVSGVPSDLAALIQFAYASANFSSVQPLQLSSPKRLKQTECPWGDVLPSGVDCTLEVSIEYFNSDRTGYPIMSAPKHCTAECNIWTNGECTTPTKIKLPLLQLVQSVPEENNKLEITYPGWFAIDFGTSNSTVTLYDPKTIVTPDGLPYEQEVRLRERLISWLNRRPVDDVRGVGADAWDLEWQKFLRELTKQFPDIDPNNENVGTQLLSAANSTTLLEAIRQIEIALGKRLAWFRRAASKCLNQIYHDVFRVPALEWQSLISVELDKDRRLSEIPSELEVVELKPVLPNDDLLQVKVRLGKQAKDNREFTIREGEEIDGRFLHSPKRYFGQERNFKIALNGQEDSVPVNKMLQAAYAELIDLTEDYRQRYPGKCSSGKFYRAVLTYPTIASPFVRREIEQLVKQLGITDVQMAYDEAVSAAIFFLWREFGGDLNVGIESFKTRCRSDGNKWWQNVLVLDIGGGTTDLALIRLTLEEIDPFEPGEDRGDGGRYYKLTPKLLGSSGHLQLGGELITLKLFLLLKAAIADALLSAVSEERLAKDVLKVQPEELSDRFLDNGKFQPGSLLACIDREIPESEAYKEALTAAERVIPTRWKQSSLRAQTFYTLWEYAEIAKLTLGQKDRSRDSINTFVLDGQKIAELLAQNEVQLPGKLIDRLNVTITQQQFAASVLPVIQEAVGIAQGLIENALGSTPVIYRTNSLTSPRTDTQTTYNLSDRQKNYKENDKEQVDWLILSGKTCNLELVEKELYHVFSKSDYFVWNQERVTFEPEYTKLATSAGACFAEKLRQLSFSPQQSKDLLRKGANQLYIDVKNLFYFLPCSFKREVIGGNSDPIFQAGEELYQLQANDSIAKLRSNWQGMQLTNNIKRQDFENVKPQLWGYYNGDALMKKLGMSEEEFKNYIKVQFEINQKLEIDLLLCRGNPHYLISLDAPKLEVAKVTGKSVIIGDDSKVVCDIAVNVAESANALKTDAHTVLVNNGEDYTSELRVLRYEEGSMEPQSIGLIAELPPFPASGKHTFYFQFRNPQSNKWELIGELPEPKITTEYPCRYYVSLNYQGTLRIHTFEVPYWTSTDIESLKEEGCVFRDTLELQPNDIESTRDPFSGEH